MLRDQLKNKKAHIMERHLLINTCNFLLIQLFSMFPGHTRWDLTLELNTLILVFPFNCPDFQMFYSVTNAPLLTFCILDRSSSMFMMVPRQVNESTYWSVVFRKVLYTLNFLCVYFKYWYIKLIILTLSVYGCLRPNTTEMCYQKVLLFCPVTKVPGYLEKLGIVLYISSIKRILQKLVLWWPYLHSTCLVLKENWLKNYKVE